MPVLTLFLINTIQKQAVDDVVALPKGNPSGKITPVTQRNPSIT
ncbi:hypothetical protein [Dulcicalothrix desertica]|nr:hypothetical protein [Dulcicalothrix desertica]